MKFSLTGVPGSGKSTLCKSLNELGFTCLNALDFKGADHCVENKEVDTECLKQLIEKKEGDFVVESHFSHFLGCDYVIILERGEKATQAELEKRNYSPGKISENLDALRSDTIYYEALEKLPAGRISRIKVTEGRMDLALSKFVELIESYKNKH